MDRLPYQVTDAAAPYCQIRNLPVVIVLENIRSAYNAGSFFRTADAASIDRIYLCGITPSPPHRGVCKTALGAQETVFWEHGNDAVEIARKLSARGYEIAAIETAVHAVDLFDWVPRFPVCLLFGNEVEGLSPALSDLCDTHVRIPMLGTKHSLNVATAGGVVLYELLRKYRRMLEYSPLP